MSKDISNNYIVSASCDGILNIWDINKYSNNTKNNFNNNIDKIR